MPKPIAMRLGRESTPSPCTGILNSYTVRKVSSYRSIAASVQSESSGHRWRWWCTVGVTLVLVEAVVVQNHVASRSVESSVREGNLQCVAVPAAARVLVDAIDSVGAHVERAVVEGGTGVDAKITSRDVNLVRGRHRRVQRRG